MAKHLVVISEDALVYEDLRILRHTPNFARHWDRSARIRKVRSIYPTLTYPAHTTMRTGVFPAKHGIVNNEQKTLCEVSSTWEFFNDAVKVKDLFDACKAQGLSTAGVFWPVTGNHPSIDYLINEYWPQSPEESAEECFIHSGSSREVLEKVIKPNLHLLEHRIHPYCDAFIHACACFMIREFKPNLLMIHPANIDTYRHQTGIFSDLVTHGLHEIDYWLGDIIKAVRDAGILEDTAFFIVSDHGQINVTRKSAPNVRFRERGIIDVDSSGNITDYLAFSKAAGMSAHVYLKNPCSAQEHDRVHDVLLEMRDEGGFGIERVYLAEEAAREEGLAGGFSFVLETDGSTTFINDWLGAPVRAFSNDNLSLGRGAHGHHPDKGPQPTLFAFGQGIKPDVVLDSAFLVDLAPTFAHALGVRLEEAQGRALTELFQ